LCKICLKDSKQNHQVIVGAINVFATLISQAMNDRANQGVVKKQASSLEELLSFSKGSTLEENSRDLEIRKAQVPKPSKQELPPSVSRNPQWLKETSSRITSLIRQLSTIRSHSSWKVRLSFVELAFTLLSRCPFSLEPAIPMLVDILVFYLDDEYKQVKDVAQSHLLVQISLPS